MLIKWMDPSLVDLKKIELYIARDKPQAARQIARKIKLQVSRLQEFPTIGRTGQVAGTRELIISATPFLVIYRIQKDEIEVMRVLHTSMRWPNLPD